MERWLLRGNRNTATGLVGELHGRVATPVMFGGGTLAIVTNPGALVVKGEDRDAFLAAIGLVAPGNGLVILDASDSGAKAPAPKRLADAIAAAGGTVRQFKSPREGALAGWIEAEARERGMQLAPGRRQDPGRAGRWLRSRGGRRTQPADADRVDGARQARRSTAATAPISPDDVRALVAEAVPGSVWAFTDAVAERRVERALDALDRLLETTPEPVLLAVLHRRIRELIETGDRLAVGRATARRRQGDGRQQRVPDGEAPRSGKAWTTEELIAALDGLVELDAMVKGVPGLDRIEAQRRLAFSLWVIDHAGREPAGAPDGQSADGPGLLLDDEVALDGEDAAALTQVEQLDQVRVDVQLRAVLAQAARDAEAQPLAAVGQAERRVEPGRDEPAGTGGASISDGGHAATVGASPQAPA